MSKSKSPNVECVTGKLLLVMVVVPSVVGVTVNPGQLSGAPFWQLSEDQWRDMIDVNLTGVWHTVKAVTPHLIDQGSGSIVITSSVNGLEPGKTFAHYVAAKHGVIGLMKNIALELAPYGVRCNAVCPGAIDTPMTHWQGAYDMFHGGPGGTIEDQRMFVPGPLGFSFAIVGAMLPHAAHWLARVQGGDS